MVVHGKLVEFLIVSIATNTCPRSCADRSPVADDLIAETRTLSCAQDQAGVSLKPEDSASLRKLSSSTDAGSLQISR